MEKQGVDVGSRQLRPPPVDSVRERVAMSRVEESLLGGAPSVRLDRYALLERIGEGSYGTVYAAWDPRLDRKVALKVLRGDLSGSLEREARTLAKLSHPNVVAVHDVGVAAGRWFLSMEFVDGRPLSRVESRGWRETVTIYRQAAAALMAAHAVGVLHRDFKPSNALLGTDGRVRVVDFGLARTGMARTEELGTPSTTDGAGTPRYMAPEQHGAGVLDERTDQFGFCAALWEALYGKPPFLGDSLEALVAAKQRVPPLPRRSGVPRRLGRVLQRGLAPKPARRYRSMEHLDGALRGVLSRRARWFVASAAGATVLTALVSTSLNEAPCEGAESLPPRWTAETRERLYDVFEQTHVPHGPTVAKTSVRLLDDWTRAWGALRLETCRGHVAGLVSSERLDRVTDCTDVHRVRFSSLLDVLLEADDGVVDGAVKAIASLPSPSTCRQNTVAPRFWVSGAEEEDVQDAQRALAHAQSQLDVGNVQQAAVLAKPWVEACVLDTLNHPPTCADAYVVSAEAASYLGEHDDALQQLRVVVVEAVGAGSRDVFARAAGALAWERGQVDAAFDEALTWVDLGIDALDERSPVLASLLNTRGAVLASAGRFEEARKAHLERIALVGDDSPHAMASFANLANIANQTGKTEDAEDAFSRALALGIPALGSTHPRVLMIRQNRAGMRVAAGRVREGREELLEIDRGLREVLGEEHPARIPVLTNLSMAAFSLEDPGGALRHAREALRLLAPAYGDGSHLEVDVRLAEADALVALGRPGEAVQVARTAVERARSAYGDEHVVTGFALRALGLAYRANGEGGDGARHLRAALSCFAALGNQHEVQRTEVMLDEP